MAAQKRQRPALSSSSRARSRDLPKGFSLLEILIVISIIAVLATIGTYSYRSSQARARDTQRKADLVKIASALERYYADKGYYPNSFFKFGSGVEGTFIPYLGVSTIPEWIQELNRYIDKFPRDPRQAAFKFDWLAKIAKIFTFPAASADATSCPSSPLDDKQLPKAADFNNDNQINYLDMAQVLDCALGGGEARCGQPSTCYNVLWDIDGGCTDTDGDSDPYTEVCKGNGTINFVGDVMKIAELAVFKPSLGSLPDNIYLYQTPIRIPLNLTLITHPHRTYVLWAKLENQNDPDIWSKNTAKCRWSPNSPRPNGYQDFFNNTGYCVTSPFASDTGY